ncbi:MAG: hypothetical protein ACE5D2_01780 [Fidelibacterota bacterium]
MSSVKHKRFFTRLLPVHRSRRSFLWLVGMLIIVLWLIVYLNGFSEAG